MLRATGNSTQKRTRAASSFSRVDRSPLLLANRRREAYAAFVKGLRLQNDHRGIIQDLKHMGVRRRRILPFLTRDNPVNVFLGRLRTHERNGGGT